MLSMADFTELSESTSITEILMGSFSAKAVCPSSGARDGSRMVAYTLCPALPSARAVANPMPVLVPVINTDAMVVLLLECSGFAVYIPHGSAVWHAVQTKKCGLGLHLDARTTALR